MVLRLLSRKKADQHEQRAKHQPDQHDFAMSGFVGIVEGRGHAEAIQLQAQRAISAPF